MMKEIHIFSKTVGFYSKFTVFRLSAEKEEQDSSLTALALLYTDDGTLIFQHAKKIPIS